MTRQVTNLLLLYQSTFPLHPSQPHVCSFFNLFFFFSNTRYTHHKSSTPLRTLPTLLTIKRLFFHSSVLHKIHISLSLSLSLSGSQIYCLSLQYHHRFLSSSLKICRYHSKMPISTPSINIQSVSLSQAQPILRKKDFIAKIYSHHQQI